MDREKVLNRMRKLCSAREYCKSDIRKKIETLVDVEVNSDELISTLCKEKFIDERRYAEAFVKDKTLLQGWGERKVKYALVTKGISQEDISEAFLQLDQNVVLERLTAILENKYKTLKGTDDERKVKLYRFALGKGFPYEKIKVVYDNIRTNKRD